MTGIFKIEKIWFTTGKDGRRTAWFWADCARRGFRLSVSEAEMLIAHGAATEIAKPGTLAA